MAEPTTPTELDDFLGVKPAPAWHRYAKWIAIGVGVILLLLLAKHFIGGGDTTQYSTVPVERGNLSVTVSATGKLAPTNQVTVGSQLSGLVTKVVVDVNDRVIAGQPLALIDPEQLEDQIRQGNATLQANQAQVGQAQATLSESRAQLARLEEVARLSGGRVPSKTELQTGRATYQRSVAALKVAQANVVAARAALSQSQTQRARAIIRSPVSGVVLARQVEPGQTVASSFNTPTLFVIAEDMTKMKLEVAIDEADVGEVAEGQNAIFTVDAFPGKVFPARIVRVDLGSNLSATSGSTTTTTTSTATVVSYAATLSLANVDGKLRPGMTATADITTSDKSNVLLVPNAALRFKPAVAKASTGITGALTMRRGGGGSGGAKRTATVGRGAQQTVYVLDAERKPKAMTVTTGDTNGSMTEVLSGLKPGAQVITGQFASGADAAKGGSGRRASGGAVGGGQ